MNVWINNIKCSFLLGPILKEKNVILNQTFSMLLKNKNNFWEHFFNSPAALSKFQKPNHLKGHRHILWILSPVTIVNFYFAFQVFIKSRHLFANNNNQDIFIHTNYMEREPLGIEQLNNSSKNPD